MSHTIIDYFKFKCWKGLKARGLDQDPIYQHRLQYEIDVISKSPFVGYFLIVQDFLNWARSQNIFVGPGRGSAAGSLVSYCLGITALDPIRWKLLFERFLNPDRVSQPDIDIDIEKKHRDKVIQYVMDKYGRDCVGHIGTFNYMRAKSAVKSMARTLGYPYDVGEKIANMLLDPIHGKPQPLKESLAKVPELQTLLHSQTEESKILHWALQVEGLVSAVGVHASGIVIANKPLTETVPVFLSKDGEITTQFSMNDVEAVGLIKFDFLGLDALTKVHTCIDIIQAKYGLKIDPDNLDLEDTKTFENLRAGDSIGIFQLEASTGMRDLMVQIRPTEIEDLIALVAIFRPGPLGSDYLLIYLGVRAGERDPEYLVPELKPILKSTAGWIIYQEQCMEIAKQLCGYTGGDADDLRKAIGKKLPDKMAKHEAKFKAGWKRHSLPEAQGAELWEQIVKFASYGFNRSHAAAYAMITYQTAWLKTHYPTEYMCAVMIAEAEARKHDQLIQCLTECKRLGIKVLPPDINSSEKTFTVTGPSTIRFGLGPIKNLGESVNTILEERQKQPFQSFLDFCQRADLSIVNRKKIESLVLAGAFDSLGQTRATNLAQIESVWTYKEQLKSFNSKYNTYQKKIQKYEERLGLIAQGLKKKPFAVPEVPERPSLIEVQPLIELPPSELVRSEHELLGFFISSHPLDNFLAKNQYDTIEIAKELRHGSHTTIAVVITSITEITTKTKKAKMCFLNAEDTTGSIEIVIFPAMYKDTQPLLETMNTITIRGVVDVTETDEKRVAKIRALTVKTLEIPKAPVQPTHCTISAISATEFTKILDRYQGTDHRIKISLQLQKDQALLTLKEPITIGGNLQAFLQEVQKLT